MDTETDAAAAGRRRRGLLASSSSSLPSYGDVSDTELLGLRRRGLLQGKPGIGGGGTSDPGAIGGSREVKWRVALALAPAASDDFGGGAVQAEFSCTHSLKALGFSNLFEG